MLSACTLVSYCISIVTPHSVRICCFKLLLYIQVDRLSAERRAAARYVSVSQVLGTDMKKHFDILSRFQVGVLLCALQERQVLVVAMMASCVNICIAFMTLTTCGASSTGPAHTSSLCCNLSLVHRCLCCTILPFCCAENECYRPPSNTRQKEGNKQLVSTLLPIPQQVGRV